MPRDKSASASINILEENNTIDRDDVERLLAKLSTIAWQAEGSVAVLVETPEPHRHVARESVRVIAGKGFSGDHDQKSFYRGVYVPGREVTAISSEVLDILGVDHVLVGDNLITMGIDLRQLQAGDMVHVGEVELERSPKAHRPCQTFRARSSPEAFAVVSREQYRGALFRVVRGGTIRRGDSIVVASRSCSSSRGILLT